MPVVPCLPCVTWSLLGMYLVTSKADGEFVSPCLIRYLALVGREAFAVLEHGTGRTKAWPREKHKGIEK